MMYVGSLGSVVNEEKDFCSFSFNYLLEGSQEIISVIEQKNLKSIEKDIDKINQYYMNIYKRECKKNGYKLKLAIIYLTKPYMLRFEFNSYKNITYEDKFCMIDYGTDKNSVDIRIDGNSLEDLFVKEGKSKKEVLDIYIRIIELAIKKVLLLAKEHKGVYSGIGGLGERFGIFNSYRFRSVMNLNNDLGYGTKNMDIDKLLQSPISSYRLK